VGPHKTGEVELDGLGRSASGCVCLVIFHSIYSRCDGLLQAKVICCGILGRDNEGEMGAWINEAVLGSERDCVRVWGPKCECLMG